MKSITSVMVLFVVLQVKYLPWIQKLVKIVECETMVRCSWSWNMHRCTALINTTECQIVFNEIANPAVTELTISGKSDVIPDLADAVSKFENLDTVVIANLLVKEVQRDRLTPFTNITKLDLSSNDISRFDAPDTFNDLANLEELDISRNKLTELHDNIFKELYNLEIINLNYNQLESIPPGLFLNNVKTKIIFLRANQLLQLHVDQFKELSSLEILFLPDNKLETLPAGLFHGNGKLLNLRLSENQLRELHSDQFKELSSLEILRLSDNKLETLPVGLFHGNNGKLRVLSFANNQLRELHSDLFKQLPSLEKITLKNNQLETIPSGLFRNNKELSQIHLKNNKIKKIEPDFKRMTLWLLDLSENVCINDRCAGFGVDSCNESNLSRIFDKIKQNC